MSGRIYDRVRNAEFPSRSPRARFDKRASFTLRRNTFIFAAEALLKRFET